MYGNLFSGRPSKVLPWSWSWQKSLIYITAVCVSTVFVVSSLCPISFSSPVHTAPPDDNTGHPVPNEPHRLGVSRPAKARSYRHSGLTDSIHRWYECYRRSHRSQRRSLDFSCPGLTLCVSLHVIARKISTVIRLITFCTTSCMISNSLSNFKHNFFSLSVLRERVSTGLHCRSYCNFWFLVCIFRRRMS